MNDSGSDRFTLNAFSTSRMIQTYLRNMDDDAFAELLKTDPLIDQLLDNFRKPNNRRVILQFFRQMYEIGTVTSDPVDPNAAFITLLSRAKVRLPVGPEIRWMQRDRLAEQQVLAANFLRDVMVPAIFRGRNE